MGKSADGAGDLADAHRLAGAPHAFDVAQQLGVPQRELEAEGHHLGMDAVGPADHRRLLVFLRARLDRLGERRHVLQDQVARLDHLQRLRRIDDVGRRQAEVEPAGRGPDNLRHRGREGDHVVLRRFFNLVDAGDVECALVFEVSCRFGRHDPGGGHGFCRGYFHLKPRLVSALLAPDATHFGVGVTGDHREPGTGNREPKKIQPDPGSRVPVPDLERKLLLGHL
jgi:hypothetical protein